MTKQEFIDMANKGWAYTFKLRGEEWDLCSFPRSGYCAVGHDDVGVECKSPEEVLERLMIDGVPFADLLHEITDVEAIPCA